MIFYNERKSQQVLIEGSPRQVQQLPLSRNLVSGSMKPAPLLIDGSLYYVSSHEEVVDILELHRHILLLVPIHEHIATLKRAV